MKPIYNLYKREIVYYLYIYFMKIVYMMNITFEILINVVVVCDLSNLNIYDRIL